MFSIHGLAECLVVHLSSSKTTIPNIRRESSRNGSIGKGFTRWTGLASPRTLILLNHSGTFSRQLWKAKLQRMRTRNLSSYSRPGRIFQCQLWLAWLALCRAGVRLSSKHVVMPLSISVDLLILLLLHVAVWLFTLFCERYMLMLWSSKLWISIKIPILFSTSD